MVCFEVTDYPEPKIINQIEFKALKRKVETMRERGLSYQSIADSFNLWKVATRTGGGQWHPKTVREIEVKTLGP